MKKKIDSYFSRLTAKENSQREIDDRVKERREAAKTMRPVERTAEQNVSDEFDFIVDETSSQ